jgi:Flp pilus assembly protein TadG
VGEFEEMSLKSIVIRISETLAKLRRADAGAIAVTYAVAGAFLVTLAFAGIDLSRAAVTRNNLQDALDSATLAAGQTRSVDTTVLNTTGKKYMAAVLSGDKTLKNLTSSFTPTSKKVVGLASADMSPIIVGLFTGGDIHIVAHSEVVRGQDQIVELALVLDTTGSMTGSKIATLKVAAAGLVTSVFNATDAGTVKVALVPFAQHVNMGIASRNQPWANVPADVHEWIPKIQTPSCTYTQCTGTTSYPCQKDDYVTTTCTGYKDGVPYSYSCKKKSGSHTGTCTKDTGCTTKNKSPCPPPVDNGYWHDEHFYGCYGSPAYPDNVKDDNPNRKYAGLMNYNCSTQAIALTTDKSSIIAAIDSFTADGETYIPAGLDWGFNMLTKPQPMTEAMEYDTDGPNIKPRKILVLMTDGANTKQMDHGDSRGPHTVSAIPAPEADQYTKELCNNIKAKGIEVYSVAFEISGNPGAKNLVKACASDNDHFFDATNQAALLDAFEQIAQSIQNLRISH